MLHVRFKLERLEFELKSLKNDDIIGKVSLPGETRLVMMERLACALESPSSEADKEIADRDRRTLSLSPTWPGDLPCPPPGKREMPNRRRMDFASLFTATESWPGSLNVAT